MAEPTGSAPPAPPDLPDDLRWRLEKADGYLDLGMAAQAATELEKVPAAQRDHRAWRAVRLRWTIEAGAWAEGAELAAALRAEQPDDPGVWIQEAYARRRCQDIPAARIVLEEARSRFPKEPIIPFNLACYACREGDLARARRLLVDAVRLQPAVRDLALEDEDLRPLWPELGDPS